MEGNGIYREQLRKIEAGLDQIKDDLSHSVDKLALSVDALTHRIDAAMRIAETVIPIKVVFWMWAIMLVGLVGVEGVKYLATLH